MILNILNKARRPNFKGTDDSEWNAPTLKQYIQGYNKARNADIDENASVADLASTVKTWIAGKTLLGDAEAETLEDLVFFPVVEPGSEALNANALRAVLSGRGAQAGIPEEAKESAQEMARTLLDSEVKAENREKAVINSKTSGKYEEVIINNRVHIKTGMVPIVGDTVMNDIFYSNAEVEKSFGQLDMLPAPNGHPHVNGRMASAFHPLAVNTHNIGGFIRDPNMEGKTVVCSFLLDKEIAEKTEGGKELISRIENNERVPVSTGLTLTLKKESGRATNGRTYSAVGQDFQFDHVAILLNEEAAGGEATKLVTNSEGEKIHVCNLTASALHDMLREKLTKVRPVDDDGWLWVQDIILDQSKVVFEEMRNGVQKTYTVSFSVDGDSVSIGDDFDEVVKKVEFVKKETDMEINVENATEHLEGKGFKVVGSERLEAVENFEKHEEGFNLYLENKDGFEAWQKSESERIENKRKELVEASGLTEEAVAGMDEGTIDTLLNSRTSTDNSLRLGGGEVGDKVTAGTLKDEWNK